MSEIEGISTVAPNSQNSKSRHDDPPFLHLKTTKKSSNSSLLFTINRYPISRLSGNQQPQPQPYRDRPNSAPPTTPKQTENRCSRPFPSADLQLQWPFSNHERQKPLNICTKSARNLYYLLQPNPSSMPFPSKSRVYHPKPYLDKDNGI